MEGQVGGLRTLYNTELFVDWISATLDLIEASGLEGADLVGLAVGAVLAPDELAGAVLELPD
ncbi:MAG: hypothetical protein V3V67_02265 [Myxococcota bacterium]